MPNAHHIVRKPDKEEEEGGSPFENCTKHNDIKTSYDVSTLKGPTTSPVAIWGNKPSTRGLLATSQV